MFVLMGMVRTETALRVIYLDIILYSMGGVIGTMHHLYFSGTPATHMALGATFSAMEVIPLMLLTLEAWGFMKSGEKSVASRVHLHRWAVWFLVAVGVWNFFGAGVFGFLINLPAVSYYEIGTNLTANHGHTAMMGVYGMLAVGLLLFCLRYLTRPDMWSDRAAAVSFWSLNIGLALDGVLQSLSCRHCAVVPRCSKWILECTQLRLSGDTVGPYTRVAATAGRCPLHRGGALPLLWMCWRGVRYPNRPPVATGSEAASRPLFTELTEEM